MIINLLVKKINLLSKLFLLACLFFQITYFRLQPNWESNNWSLKFIQFIFNDTFSNVIEDYPVYHSHASIWLANYYLQSTNLLEAGNQLNLNSNQTDPLYFHMKGKYLLLQGDIEGAISAWAKVNDINSILATAKLTQANSENDLASLAYHTAWQLDPEKNVLKFANFLIDVQKKYSDAENILNQAMVKYPNSQYWSFWAWRLGDALRGQEKWSQAIDVYHQSLAKNPDNPNVYIGLGWAQYGRGDDIQSVANIFKIAIALQTNRGEGQFAMGQLLLQAGQNAQADYWFEQALHENPDARWWYLARGNAAIERGAVQCAINVFETVIARFPDFSPPYFELAQVYWDSGNSDKAIKILRQVMSLSNRSNNISYMVSAGKIFEAAGLVDDARGVYEEVLMIEPNNIIAINRLTEIEKMAPSK